MDVGADCGGGDSRSTSSSSNSTLQDEDDDTLRNVHQIEFVQPCSHTTLSPVPLSVFGNRNAREGTEVATGLGAAGVGSALFLVDGEAESYQRVGTGTRIPVRSPRRVRSSGWLGGVLRQSDSLDPDN